jgi:hypothetical protein
MEKIVDVVKAGMGFPACHFDDSHIKMMLRKGFDQRSPSGSNRGRLQNRSLCAASS